MPLCFIDVLVSEKLEEKSYINRQLSLTTGFTLASVIHDIYDENIDLQCISVNNFIIN